MRAGAAQCSVDGRYGTVLRLRRRVVVQSYTTPRAKPKYIQARPPCHVPSAGAPRAWPDEKWHAAVRHVVGYVRRDHASAAGTGPERPGRRCR